MSVNILTTNYTNTGFKPNMGLKEIVVTLDGAITISEINNFLPNNGSRYNKTENIDFIPSGSNATILSGDTMYVCIFIAEEGLISTQTGYKEGKWKCIAKTTYIV